jgi:glycerophosphoryl diester phosphodiesterase
VTLSLVPESSFSQDACIIVAHRGASATESENTLAAFEAAIGAGADAVEFDVRLTADAHPVVLHDADVSRTTDGSGSVHSMTLEELRGLRIRGSDVGVIPTLTETLELLSGRAGVDIELKNIPGEPDYDPDVEPLVSATLEALGSTSFTGPVLVSSFNPLAIAAVREREPRLATGLLTMDGLEADVALGFAQGQGHAWVLPAVAMVEAAGPAFAVRAHDVGMRVGTWVVDDPERAAALARTGVDAIATNDPAAVVPAVRVAR